MPNAARKLDFLPVEEVAPVGPVWSGDVHGPVAALHQAIEDGLAGSFASPYLAPPANDVVEGWLRHASRATGWGVLTLSFAATVALIF